MSTLAPTKPKSGVDLSVPGFPALERRILRSGEIRTRVRGGVDIWHYVFAAQGHDFDVEATAEHMDRSISEVRAALDYYKAEPAEVDAHLAEIERWWERVHIDPVTDRITLR